MSVMSSHPAEDPRRYVLVPAPTPLRDAADLRRFRLARLNPVPLENRDPDRFEYLKRTYD
jgi:hypothetical protein